MKRTTQMAVMVTALFLLGLGVADAQTPLGTEFTFQGRLQDAGQPANGSYNMKFELYGSEVGGSQIGLLQVPNVTVTDGLFTVELDYGPGVFDNSRRWLQITIESTTLSPRQPITGAPYAIETRGLDVVEDGGGMRVGVGLAGNDTFNVFTDTTGFGGMRVETPATGSPRYGYQSGNNQSVYHYLDYDSQSWRLSNGGDRITARADGFVGINRSDRLENVDSEIFGIYKATSGLGGMITATDANGEPYYGYGTDGNLKAYHYYTDNGAELRFKFAGTPTAMTIDSLGILEVANPLAFKPGGGPWSAPSDRRLKKNIDDLNGSLAKLMQLRGVTFEYLDPKSIDELDGTRTGFVAQEVEKVFPEWVDQRADGYLALTPRGFEALAVEAIRELRDEKNKQIATLQCQNEQLQDENEELRDRLEVLELQVQQLVESMQPQQR